MINTAQETETPPEAATEKSLLDQIEAVTSSGLARVKDETLNDTLALDDFVFKGGEQGYYLEHKDDKQVCYQLSENAFVQLCSLVKVPHTFVAKSPVELANNILEHWYPLKEKKPTLIRYFKGLNGEPIIRGLINEKETSLLNYLTAVTVLQNNLPEHSYIGHAEGGSMLAPDMYLRVLIPSVKAIVVTSTEPEPDMFIGSLDIRMSDCGALKQITIDIGAYHWQSEAALLIKQDRKYTYRLKHSGKCTQDMFTGVIVNALNDLQVWLKTLVSVINKSASETLLPNVKLTLLQYEDFKGISANVLSKVAEDLEEEGVDSMYEWELLARILRVAAEQTDVIKKATIETFVARQLNLKIEGHA